MQSKREPWNVRPDEHGILIPIPASTADADGERTFTVFGSFTLAANHLPCTVTDLASGRGPSHRASGTKCPPAGLAEIARAHPGGRVGWR